MNRRRFSALVITLLLMAFGISTISASAAPPRSTEFEINQQLARVRAATAKYHDVRVAIADGYVPTEHCLEVPSVGTMGLHYLNPTYASDAVIDPLKPELLLYIPTTDGVKLVAVEYFVASAAVSERPTIFSQPFDGPMDGHEPGMPEHYDLHVWLWEHNPNGMFAQFNPSIHCPE